MPPRPNPWLIAAVLLVLYLVWGSTYLGMHWAVEAYPPFIVAATRAVLSGAFLYTLLRRRAVPPPTLAQWRSAAIVGGLLLLGGNGLATFSSQYLPSGLVALILSMLPVWMVLFDGSSAARRSPLVWLGIALGLGGVIFLIWPKLLIALAPSAERKHMLEAGAMGVLLCSSLCWATGSLYSRRAPRHPSAFLNTGMQLLAGGLLLTLASAATGEWSRFSIDAIAATPRATLALAYLVLFGTLLGYTCYIWLLGAAPPSVSSSYAYINPLVAVILGASLGREPLTGRTLLAAGIIIAGVVILVTAGQASRRRRPPAQPEVAISDASAAGAKV